MLINATNLAGIFTGFKALFNQGAAEVPPTYKKIAMVAPSSTREQTYGWLGQFPGFREWVGPRVIANLTAHGFTIVNKDFENTIAVKRNDIADDQFGIFAPIFQELGRASAEFPNELVYNLLKSGFAEPCYDGQNFFDTDHPVGDEPATVSNFGGGSGTAWFLLDTSRALKPIIYQERAPFNLIKKDQPDDDNVFLNKEFIYGVDGRCNVGFGLWQLAYGSKQTLDSTSYAAARAAMQSLRGDSGRPLNIKPDTLVVPPSLESAALKLLNSELASGGESNEWKGTATPLVTVWVA
jgi:phage major head subunit gpT-like protein